MSTLKVYDNKGAASGDIEFADDLLVNDRGNQAVRDMVVAYQAAQRAGTASTLSKGEVAGSNKKPWRQKGLGKARAGYRQSPVWRGGGVAFGPKPRDYGVKVNRKVARLAFRRAFTERVQADQVKVIEDLSLAEARTKAFVDIMKSLNVQTPALFIIDKVDKNLALASRNVPKVEVVRASDVNVYQLMRYPLIVISKPAVDVIKQRLGGAES